MRGEAGSPYMEVGVPVREVKVSFGCGPTMALNPPMEPPHVPHLRVSTCTLREVFESRQCGPSACMGTTRVALTGLIIQIIKSVYYAFRCLLHVPLFLNQNHTSWANVTLNFLTYPYFLGKCNSKFLKIKKVRYLW